MGQGRGKGEANKSCWVVSFAVACVIIVGLAAALAYVLYDRQSSNSKDTASNLILNPDTSDPYQTYVKFLRTPEEQAQFAAAFEVRQQERRRVTETLRSDTPCLYQCSDQWDVCPANNPQPQKRRKRSSVDEAVRQDRASFFVSQLRRTKRGTSGEGQSSCCPSQTEWQSPDTMVNVVGTEVTLFHDNPRRQFVNIEKCQQVTGCFDCTCYEENTTMPLVVASGSDLTIDYFSIPSCCKCLFS